MGLFSGLESLGLGKMKNVEIFENEEGKQETGQETSVAQKQKTEKDLLFDKSYTCPVCGHEFKCKVVRAGKAKLISSDLDLRAKYELIEPLKYEAIVCDKCGYSALSRFFNRTTSAQEKNIREKITPNFKGIHMDGDSYSYEDAVTRYKLALLNTVVKGAKDSEKAYTCLKMGWLFRGQAENLPEDTPNREAVLKDLKAQEKECMKNAYEGFNAAFSKENFPMCGMDDVTVMFLVAELARQCGKYEESGRWISEILMSKTANERLKEKAREVKDLIAKAKGK